MEKIKLIRAVIGFLIYMLLTPALLFISAGTWHWTMAWVYTLLGLAAIVISRLVALKKSPEMLRERARFTENEGTPAWDRALVPVIAIYGPMLSAIVAGLDERFGWSGGISPAVQWAAAGVVALGYGMGVWAMISNPFFSAVVRIQGDRGHSVVNSGPYRFVRHPSYAGGILAMLVLPLMLDSLWMFIPVAGLIAGIVARTALEDRTLMAELPGYTEYASRTRYRLIPGIW